MAKGTGSRGQEPEVAQTGAREARLQTDAGYGGGGEPQGSRYPGTVRPWWTQPRGEARSTGGGAQPLTGPWTKGGGTSGRVDWGTAEGRSSASRRLNHVCRARAGRTTAQKLAAE